MRPQLNLDRVREGFSLTQNAAQRAAPQPASACGQLQNGKVTVRTKRQWSKQGILQWQTVNDLSLGTFGVI